MNPYHDKRGLFSSKGGGLSGAAKALKRGAFRGTSGELALARQELTSAAQAHQDKTFDFVSRHMSLKAKEIIAEKQRKRRK